MTAEASFNSPCVGFTRSLLWGELGGKSFARLREANSFFFPVCVSELFCHTEKLYFRAGSGSHHPLSSLKVNARVHLNVPSPTLIRCIMAVSNVFCAARPGYDGGSSDSECESPTLDDQETVQSSPPMPDFWLLFKIHQDRVEVFSHSRYAAYSD